MNTKKATLLNAALAGLIATGGALTLISSAHAATGEKCYGVNGCKGTGECGGKGHGCAGHNGCKGQGWVTMNKEECVKKGGSLEDKAASAAPAKEAPVKK